MFTVLSVAYPFAPVGPDAVGGAEQILTTLEAGLAGAGLRSLVLAAPGSRVHGTLIPGPPIPDIIDDGSRRQVWRRCSELVAEIIDKERVDLVHVHGVDFAEYLPPPEVPTVVSLHLPLAWYPADVLALGTHRHRVHFVCVSRAQRRSGGDAWAAVPIIENGVAIPPRRPTRKRRFALCLGRICPEKAFHLAVLAARKADIALAIAGQVFPYPAHTSYFAEQLAPLLDHRRRFLGPIGGRRKARLLAAAQCLVVPSEVEETSSLVAMEALASGTPVVASRIGALVDLVEPGRTGYLVDGVDECAAAIEQAGRLDPAICRTTAADRWGAPRMIANYLTFYDALLQQRRPGADLRV
jgi:glycosyltransferase involved in cell wall biosynthesis